MPKKVLVALPDGLLEQVDFVAQVEHRTRSDLIREALRRYVDVFKRSQAPRMSVSTLSLQKEHSVTKGAERGARSEASLRAEGERHEPGALIKVALITEGE